MQVVALDLVDPGEQHVEAVGDAEVAAGQAVGAATGQRDDQAGGLLGVGAAPGGELVADPALDTALWRPPAGAGLQRRAQPWWDEGGVTIVDPDGYRLVLTSRSWP